MDTKKYKGIVALDYDDTFTRDPSVFWQIAQTFKDNDYLVLCVTMRFKNEPIIDLERPIATVRLDNDASDAPVVETEEKHFIPVIYTGRLAKFYYMEAMGVEVAFWIDDSPRFLTANSATESNKGQKHVPWDTPKYDVLRTNRAEIATILYNMETFVLNKQST